MHANLQYDFYYIRNRGRGARSLDPAAHDRRGALAPRRLLGGNHANRNLPQLVSLARRRGRRGRPGGGAAGQVRRRREALHGRQPRGEAGDAGRPPARGAAREAQPGHRASRRRVPGRESDRPGARAQLLPAAHARRARADARTRHPGGADAPQLSALLRERGLPARGTALRGLRGRRTVERGAPRLLPRLSRADGGLGRDDRAPPPRGHLRALREPVRGAQRVHAQQAGGGRARPARRSSSSPIPSRIPESRATAEPARSTWAACRTRRVRACCCRRGARWRVCRS